jgi:MFS family permease
VEPIRSYYRQLQGFNRNARFYLLYSFVNGLYYSIYLLLFNLYILSLDYGPEFLGLLVAIPSIVGAVVSMPLGLLGDRIGYKQALLLGLVLICASILGITYLYTSSGLILFAIFNGLGTSLVWVINAPFMAANSTKEERTHLFSVQFSLNTFSGFFGYLIGGSLPALLASPLGVAPEGPAAYRATMLVCAGLVFASLLPLLAIERGNVGRERRLRLRAAFQRPRLLAKLLLPELIFSLGAGILIPFLNVFLKLKFTISDVLLGTVFAGQSIAIGLATLTGPLLAGRLGKVRAVVTTQLSSIPFLLLLGYSPLFSPAVVGFLVRAGLMNMAGPLYSAFVMEQVEENRRAAVNGLLSMSWSGGWALGNWASGQFQRGPGFPLIFLITCASYLVGSLFTYRFFARMDQPTMRAAEARSERLSR